MPKEVFYKINDSKRNKLAKSALEAFSKDTYDNLTVSSITQTMQILRTDFYYYFKDKADLFVAVKELLKEVIEENGMPNSASDAINNIYLFIFKQKRPKNRQFYVDLAQNYNTNSLGTFTKFLMEEYDNNAQNNVEEELMLSTKLYLLLSLVSATYGLKIEKEKAFELLKSFY